MTNGTQVRGSVKANRFLLQGNPNCDISMSVQNDEFVVKYGNVVLLTAGQDNSSCSEDGIACNTSSSSALSLNNVGVHFIKDVLHAGVSIFDGEICAKNSATFAESVTFDRDITARGGSFSTLLSIGDDTLNGCDDVVLKVNGAMKLNGDMNISCGSVYIGEAVTLSEHTLGATVINSSLTSVGTLKSLEVAGAITHISDERLKISTEMDCRDCLNGIASLRPVVYEFVPHFASMNGTPNVRHMGLMAQEVESVFPDAVRTKHGKSEISSSGDTLSDLKTIEYTSLVAPLIGAVKQLSSVVDDLADRVRKLESVQKKSL